MDLFFSFLALKNGRKGIFLKSLRFLSTFFVLPYPQFFLHPLLLPLAHPHPTVYPLRHVSVISLQTQLYRNDGSALITSQHKPVIEVRLSSFRLPTAFLFLDANSFLEIDEEVFCFFGLFVLFVCFCFCSHCVADLNSFRHSCRPFINCLSHFGDRKATTERQPSFFFLGQINERIPAVLTHVLSFCFVHEEIASKIYFCDLC